MNTADYGVLFRAVLGTDANGKHPAGWLEPLGAERRIAKVSKKNLVGNRQLMPISQLAGILGG